jgi:DNA anti-recombination protein RmuC
MKNKNNDSEVVTQKILRETLSFALDDVVIKISAKIDEKIDGAIGDLAIMVEKGFQGMTKQMDEKFERVDTRFEQVDRRFEKIDDNFEKIDRKFEKIDGQFKKVDGQFKKIDGQFDKVFSELKETRKEIGVNELKTRGDVAGLDFRVGKLEKKAGLS